MGEETWILDQSCTTACLGPYRFNDENNNLGPQRRREQAHSGNYPNNSSGTSKPEQHQEIQKKKKIILSPFNCLSFHFLIKRKHATASDLFSHLKHPSSLFSHSSLRSIPFSALPCSFKSRRLGFQHEDLKAEDENLASQSLRRKLSSQSSSDQTSW